jgi:hypothetical protein
MLSDNGAVFTGLFGGGGRVVLEVTPGRPRHRPSALPALTPADLRQGRASTRPSRNGSSPSPEPASYPSCGASSTPSAPTNTTRPYRAQARRTRLHPYQTRPKAVPTGIPLDNSHYRIRHDMIDNDGKLTIPTTATCTTSAWASPTGRRHTNTKILMLVHDLNIRVINRAGELPASSTRTHPGPASKPKK